MQNPGKKDKGNARQTMRQAYRNHSIRKEGKKDAAMKKAGCRGTQSSRNPEPFSRGGKPGKEKKMEGYMRETKRREMEAYMDEYAALQNRLNCEWSREMEEREQFLKGAIADMALEEYGYEYDLCHRMWEKKKG